MFNRECLLSHACDLAILIQCRNLDSRESPVVDANVIQLSLEGPVAAGYAITYGDVKVGSQIIRRLESCRFSRIVIAVHVDSHVRG